MEAGLIVSFCAPPLGAESLMSNWLSSTLDARGLRVVHILTRTAVAVVRIASWFGRFP
jgi:hypothetical protein